MPKHNPKRPGMVLFAEARRSNIERDLGGRRLNLQELLQAADPLWKVQLLITIFRMQRLVELKCT